jgi:hypothetical protein
MPARIRKIRHDEDTRLKIKTTQLCNRLMSHAMGEVDLSPTQIQAIKILLGKTLPDLQSVEHSGEVATPYVMQMPTVAKDAAEWLTTQSKSSGVLKKDHRPH